MVALSIIAWTGVIIGIFLLILLMVPFRIRVKGNIDHEEGVGYEFNVDWALGLAEVEKRHGASLELRLFGLKLMQLPTIKKTRERKEKKRRKKKPSPGEVIGSIRSHHRTMLRVLGKMLHAMFLKGGLSGRIGFADPAHTANMAFLYRLLGFSGSGNFRTRLVWVYDEEVIRITGEIRATLIFGYLAIVAGMLFLERQTRMMLRSLRHA